MEALDFEKVFQTLEDCYAILEVDSGQFIICAVNDTFLEATHTTRQEIIGQDIFKVFPDNPTDSSATGVYDLRSSLMRVLDEKKSNLMPIQKYDVLRSDNSGFEDRYWIPHNTPVFGESENITHIVNHSTDVTEHEQLLRQYGSHEEYISENQGGSSQVERLTNIMVSRELRMIELKKELALYKNINIDRK